MKGSKQKKETTKDEDTANKVDDLNKLTLLLESTLQKLDETTGSTVKQKTVERIASSIDRLEKQAKTTSDLVKVIICQCVVLSTMIPNRNYNLGNSGKRAKCGDQILGDGNQS